MEKHKNRIKKVTKKAAQNKIKPHKKIQQYYNITREFAT